MALGEIKIKRLIDGVDAQFEDGWVDLTYYGDPDSDGSWRIEEGSGELKFSKKISGSWVEKFSIIE